MFFREGIYAQTFYGHQLFPPIDGYQPGFSFFHPQAQNAAMTSSCAQEQGKFWEMADLLYKKQEEWGEATGKDIFKKYGIQIGLNTVQFNQCLDEDKYLEEIQNDQKLAEEFGISGTPSGFIGDQFMGGVLQEEQFKSAIEAQLAK